MEREARKEINRLHVVVNEMTEVIKTMYNVALKYGMECQEYGRIEGKGGNGWNHHTEAELLRKEMSKIVDDWGREG